jgi:hypothetical protein
MAISKTDLLNKALTQVGANPITSIDDSSNNARILSRVYEISLRSILYECQWNFAVKRILLTVSADTVPWYDTGNTYIYAKPTDIIRIFGVSDDQATWREEGDYIISDTSGLGIRYVYYLDVPSKYPAFFVDAFIDRLCSEIAYGIVNSDTLATRFKELYEGVTLPKAMAANSQIGTQQYLNDDAWENAKYYDRQFDA